MFRRKKSLGSARRDLHQLLDSQGRPAAMDWWSGAEVEMKTADMSGPASFLAMTLAMSVEPGDDIRPAARLNIVIRAGYALRALLPTVTSQIALLDVSPLDRDPIAELATRPVDPESGFLAGDDAVMAGSVLGPSAELLGDYVGDRFGGVASVDPAFWQGTVALATYQLHKNIGRLDQDLIEMLLRYGFVLRAWEESLRIASEGWESAQPLAGTPAADIPDQQPEGTGLDPESWVKEASIVCTNRYEPFSELMLELSTVELLGIQPIVDRYMNEPWQGYDPAVEAGVSHARFGYALRKRETQLIACYGDVRESDPLAALATDRADNHGVKTAVVHRIVRDVLDYGQRDLLYERTPGTTPEVRRTGIGYWATTYGDRDPRLDRETTTALIEHGYFLHRLFEIQPSYRDS